MKVLAKVYAEALAGAAFEKGIAESVRKELAGFVAAFGESPELRNFLANPAVAAEKKRGVIAALVKRLGASVTLRNLLFVVADNRRSNLLPEIQQAFEEEIYERLGMTQARVTSARELTAKEKKELAGALEQLTGKKIEAEYGLDPELIGGTVVQIGSTIYNGSVREQLNRLRARLAAE